MPRVFPERHRSDGIVTKVDSAIDLRRLSDYTEGTKAQAGRFHSFSKSGVFPSFFIVWYLNRIAKARIIRRVSWKSLG